MEQTEPAYPIDMGSLRLDAAILQANLVPDAVQE